MSLAARKSEKRKLLWTKGSMAAAVRNVEAGMGIREASRLYNIPFETLRRRINHIVPLECRSGPPTVLTEGEEHQLASYCVKMADMGFGLSREDVMHTAFKIAEAMGRKHPFSNGSAGRAWFDGFRARHPNLTIRSAQSLSHSRAACANKDNIIDFFGKLGSVYARLNIISKPMQIFNMDKVGLSIVHKPGRVVAALGRRNVWAITSAKKGRTHTILTCVSASGFTLPPFMIYPRKRITEQLKVGALPGSAFHCSESGWVTSELFMQWFHFFLENIPVCRPVLLILDGHTSHVSVEVIELAKVNGVHMLCLPAHTTHILQPLDVGVFKSLKSHYYKACRKYTRENPGRVITTEVIAELVAAAWPQSLTPVNIMGGFRKCGIYPLNHGEITDREMAPSAVTHKEVESPSPSESEASGWNEALFQKRFEEEYDMYDDDYLSWLKVHHPDSVPPHLASSTTGSSLAGLRCPSEKVSSSSTLSDILVIPKARLPGKQRKMVATKA